MGACSHFTSYVAPEMSSCVCSCRSPTSSPSWMSWSERSFSGTFAATVFSLMDVIFCVVRFRHACHDAPCHDPASSHDMRYACSLKKVQGKKKAKIELEEKRMAEL